MTTPTKLTIALIDALNQKVQKELIPQIAKSFKPGDLLAESIIDRISRDRLYSCGFTGFKPQSEWATRARRRDETEDDAIVQGGGLAGQFLIAVAPDKNSAFGTGKRDIGWRFYYANVPGGTEDAARYEPGGAFRLPSFILRDRVIDMNDAELIEILQDGILRVCSAVSEGEKDRI